MVDGVAVAYGEPAELSATGCDGTVRWYLVATGGESIYQGATYLTTALTSSTTFFASCVVEGCESTSRTAASVTVGPAPVYSIQTGDWHNPATWSCTCVPTAAHDVTIMDTHLVSITTAQAVAKTLTLQGGEVSVGENLQLCLNCSP